MMALLAVWLRAALPDEQEATLRPADLRCEYEAAPLGIGAERPRLSWIIEAVDPGARGIRQTAYRVLVASSPALLAQDLGDLWDSGRVESSSSHLVPYGGAPLRSRARCFWKVRAWDESGRPSAWSETAEWTMGLLRPEDWAPAKWVGAGAGPASGPMPIFRRAFAVEKAVRRALVSVCGLGHYELRLNGRKVGDAALEPGWTNYRKTCLYQTYDVTPLVARGENVLGVLLGNGMYNVVGGRYVKFKGTFGAPCLILRLDLELDDGTTAAVVSDASWKTAPGPIVFSCVYGGEDYDARREAPGWDGPGFDDSAWTAAAVVEAPGGVLSSRSAPPVKVMREFKPVRITQPRPGAFVYDLGQNFSGWPRVTVKGPAGAAVKMTPGELLDGDGLVSQRSSGGPVWFSYTLKGGAEESWHPRFTYYGFRYVQVEGAAPEGEPGAPDGLPRILGLSGQFIHSSAESAGEFSCSNADVVRIHDLINAAIRSNLQSVLTDCPHREKLGWLECAHLLAGCISYNHHVPRFFAKIARDMSEAQLDNGLVPTTAPHYRAGTSGPFRDSPEWGSAYVLIPWIAWQTYGDRGLLEEHYEGMKRYVAYLGTKARDHIVSYGLGDWYDVGPKAPGVSQLTSLGVTATGIYYQDIEVLRKTAELLGRADDIRTYADLAAQVRAAFNRKYFRPDANQYDRNSQTANALPLATGLVEDNRRAAVLESLVRDVRGRGNRVTAGDVGFFYVVRALSDGGRGDVLYDMVCQDEGPGYLYQLKKGATTLTEAWDADPRSSQNHCMLGHAEEWFFRGIGGIRSDPEGPGFSKIVIQPQWVAGLTWAKVRYASVRGTISTSWNRSGGVYHLEVTVPGNVTATVHVPAREASAVIEGGKPASEARGVRFVRMGGGAAVFEVGSGTYSFRSE